MLPFSPVVLRLLPRCWRSVKSHPKPPEASLRIAPVTHRKPRPSEPEVPGMIIQQEGKLQQTALIQQCWGDQVREVSYLSQPSQTLPAAPALLNLPHGRRCLSHCKMPGWDAPASWGKIQLMSAETRVLEVRCLKIPAAPVPASLQSGTR